MSGGVDSSTVAALLKEKGYEVIGITLRFHKCEADGLNVCCSPKDVQDAAEVSRRLGIPHLTIDWEELFRERVIKPFIEGYLSGLTPNPCAICNREVKTGFLARYLKVVADVDRLATGHYAKKVSYKGHTLVARGKDLRRDQSYFLALVRMEDLELLEFPLGDYTKEEVRQMAQRYNLPVAQKRDSQEVCFLMGKSPGEFIEEHVGPKEGEFVYKGKLVGKHRGIFHFTVGQRKGLGVALGKPVYVVGIDPNTNTVILGDEEDLYSKALLLKDINFHLPLELWSEPVAQVRYKNKPVKVQDIKRTEEGYVVVFEEPVRGVTPGQVCAFYEGDVLLGGGVIARAL